MDNKPETSGRYPFDTIITEKTYELIDRCRRDGMTDEEIAAQFGFSLEKFNEIMNNRKDDVNMEMNLNDVMGTLNNVSKVAANLTEKKDPPAPVNHDDSNISNPNQNVQIHIGEPEGKKDKKVKEKPTETHIHHEYPENRAMTDRECELALEKAKMQYRLESERMSNDDFWRRKEFEREEERHKEKVQAQEKARKTRTIVGAVLGAIGAALLGYSIYDSRKNPAPVDAPIKVEGEVK